MCNGQHRVNLIKFQGRVAPNEFIGNLGRSREGNKREAGILGELGLSQQLQMHSFAKKNIDPLYILVQSAYFLIIPSLDQFCQINNRLKTE